MSSLSTIIVDDEPLARARLRALLAEHEDIVVTGEFDCVGSAEEHLRQTGADLVLLDIQLAGELGIRLAERLKSSDHPCSVIITTAFRDYAVEAFDAKAVDYLLKPVDGARLADALERMRERRHSNGAAEPAQAREPQRRQRLVVPQGDRSVLLRVADIDWVESVGNYVKVHVGKCAFTMRSPLYTFELNLDADDFVRIHRRTVVNVNSIASIHRGVRRGEFTVTLRDGSNLPMQSVYASRLRSLVGRF